MIPLNKFLVLSKKHSSMYGNLSQVVSGYHSIENNFVLVIFSITFLTYKDIEVKI